MRIIGLRHGQSQYNLRGLCNDDDARRVVLTVRGVARASSAAGRVWGESIERILSSLLRRAHHIVEVIVTPVSLLTVNTVFIWIFSLMRAGGMDYRCVPTRLWRITSTCC